MGLIELAIPFFLIAVVVEVCYGLLVKCQTYNFSDSVSSLQLGMISRLIGLLRLSFAGLVDITFTPAVCFLFTRFLRAQ